MPTPSSIRSVRLLLILFFAFASLYYISRSYSRIPIPPGDSAFTRGGKSPTKQPTQLPIENDESGYRHPPLAVHHDPAQVDAKEQLGTAKAAFVSLIRNHELWDIVRSIRQIEDRFNRHYHYPWVFLNDVPFTDEFIEVTSALVSGKTKYGTFDCGGGWLMGRTGAGRTLVNSFVDR